MQSRYALALCAFALLVAVVSAQQSGQQPSGELKSLFEKLKEQVKAFDDMKAAVACMKEARENCKSLLKSPADVIKYIRCSVEYIGANEDRCNQQAGKQ